MAESMKDYEKELEESMKTIEEGDILTGTVISVDEKEVILYLYLLFFIYYLYYSMPHVFAMHFLQYILLYPDINERL